MTYLHFLINKNIFLDNFYFLLIKISLKVHRNINFEVKCYTHIFHSF